MKLIIVRHGQTPTNASGFMHKSFDKDMLTVEGVNQIAKVAEFLSKYDIECVYSSKEKRAIQSAKVITDRLEVELIEMTGLHERDWGELGGKPWKDVKKVLENKSLQERYEYLPEGGESWKDFESRLISAIEAIVSNSRKDVVIVTHGGAIRALMPFLLGKSLSESFKHDPDNASITIFEITQTGFKDIMINSIEHLE